MNGIIAFVAQGSIYLLQNVNDIGSLFPCEQSLVVMRKRYLLGPDKSAQHSSLHDITICGVPNSLRGVGIFGR